MARRPTLRTILKLERLESREVLSSGGPTAEVQELLELTNFARQNPSAAAEWATSDLRTDNLGVTLKNFGITVDQAKNDITARRPVQPLAWSGQLNQAAETMSRYQAESGQQTHTGSGGLLADGVTRVGVTLDDRLSNAGYGDAVSKGENAFAYATSVKNATKAFLIDWGNDRSVLPHLSNIYNGANREAGFGVVDSRTNGLGPKVVTEVFGARRGAGPMLVGVAFKDTVQANRMYDAGEGVGDVEIDVTDSAGQTKTVRTWDAGGYQIALAPGHYTVTAHQGDKVIRSQGVDINDQNVKVDFVLSDPWSGATLAPAAAAAPTPAPAPPKVATPKPTPPPAPPVVSTPPPVVSTPPPPVVSTPAPPPAAPAPKPVPVPKADPVVVAPKEAAKPSEPEKQADKAKDAPGKQGQVPTATNPNVVKINDPFGSQDIYWQSW